MIEDKGPAKVFIDRFILRLISTPALISALKDVVTLKEGDKTKFQLKFIELPDEARQVVYDLSGLSQDQVRSVVFSDKNGQRFTGFELVVSDNELNEPWENEVLPNVGGD